MQAQHKPMFLDLTQQSSVDTNQVQPMNLEVAQVLQLQILQLLIYEAHLPLREPLRIIR